MILFKKMNFYFIYFVFLLNFSVDCSFLSILQRASILLKYFLFVFFYHSKKKCLQVPWIAFLNECVEIARKDSSFYCCRFDKILTVYSYLCSHLDQKHVCSYSKPIHILKRQNQKRWPRNYFTVDSLSSYYYFAYMCIILCATIDKCVNSEAL